MNDRLFKGAGFKLSQLELYQLSSGARLLPRPACLPAQAGQEAAGRRQAGKNEANELK